MRILILGMGHVGKALAKTLRADGHLVCGTTTTEAKVTELSSLADEVLVLRGNDEAGVAQAAKGCDVVIVTVAPNVRQTRTKVEREEHYADVLLASCHSVAKSGVRAVFLSSFSVYGDGGDSTLITETSPVANQQEPSARFYHLAENQVLEQGGCALRFPDMYGAPGDLSFSERVKLAHEHFGGKTIFGADALLYAIHFEDVVAAVVHALYKELQGIFNVCDENKLPATNKSVFDAICEQQGWPLLEYLNHIKAPKCKISAAKLYATGYSVRHAAPFPARAQAKF